MFRSIIDEDFQFPLELEKLGCPESSRKCIITNDRFYSSVTRVGEVVSRSGFINIIRNYTGNIQTSTTLMQSSSTREISSYQIFQVEESLSKVTFISIWSLRPTSLAVRNSGYAMSGKNKKYLVTTRQGREVCTESMCFILP